MDTSAQYPATTMGPGVYSIDLSKNNASSIRHIAREEAKVQVKGTLVRDQS